MAANLMWVQKTDELPDGVYLATGKHHIWEGLITSPCFYLLPGKDPAKSVWIFWWDASPPIGASAAYKKENPDFKPENHWYLVELPLVDTGKGEYAKPASLFGNFLKQVLPMEEPKSINVKIDQAEVNLRKAITRCYTVGPKSGQPLSDDDYAQVIYEMIEIGEPVNSTSSETMAELIVRVKAFIGNAKVPGSWSGGESIADRVKFRAAFLLNQMDPLWETVGQIQLNYPELEVWQILLILLG